MAGADPVTVVTAIGGAESRLVAVLEGGRAGVVVVRRCVDAADLLATAGAGRAQVAVVPADLPWWDAAVAEHLAGTGTGVVALLPAGPALELSHPMAGWPVTVLAAEATVGEIVRAVRTAAYAAAPPATPRVPPAPVPAAPVPAAPSAGTPGQVIAVWGPTGAPGRSVVALGLASELAVLGVDTMLIDADVYGGTAAQALGVLEDSPGIAAAARLHRTGALDAAALAQLARTVPIAESTLRLVSGLVRADRWPELSANAVRAVLAAAAELASVVIVDCGFCLETDEELTFDTAVPRRNAATLTALEAAELVLVVGQADPIGVQRLVRGLLELRDVAGTPPELWVVINRWRSGPVPGDARAQVTAVLSRHTGVSPVAFLPEDRGATDACLATGTPLVEAAAASPLRRSLMEVAVALAARLPGGAPVTRGGTARRLRLAPWRS